MDLAVIIKSQVLLNSQMEFLVGDSLNPLDSENRSSEDAFGVSGTY